MSEHWDGVVVDNSSSPSMSVDNIGTMTYICNGKNLGIAEAQNIGIRYLMEHGNMEYIVLFDQDSRVPTDYPMAMVNEFLSIKCKVGNLALLGPTVTRNEDGMEYKSAIHRYTTDCYGFSQRTHIISSGSCISTEALHSIGLMDSSLFIDYVDFEWCWRARSKGYAIGVTSRMVIRHKVGQKELALGSHKVIISSPKRYFYQYRNYLWLIRCSYVPLQWKLATGIKKSLRIIYFPFILNNGKLYLKNMLKGIWAGMKRNK